MVADTGEYIYSCHMTFGTGVIFHGVITFVIFVNACKLTSQTLSPPCGTSRALRNAHMACTYSLHDSARMKARLRVRRMEDDGVPYISVPACSSIVRPAPYSVVP